MRILFDQGVYDLRNKGNVALTQVAVNRLRTMWPDATLDVMTSGPHILRLYCPGARPVSPDGAGAVARATGLSRLVTGIPRPALRLLLEVREALWNRWPDLRRRLPLRRVGPTASPRTAAPSREGESEAARGRDMDRTRRAAALLTGVDLLVATGAQYMSDPCKDAALGVLDLFEAASQRAIPTAMLGQGVGPFDDPELRARACAVYPLIDLILVRDRVAAPPLLASLGVDPARILFTGDDAIELAYEARRDAFGTDIGVSLRLSNYTLVTASDTAVVCDALHQARARHRTRLVAVPISYSSHELDERVLREAIGEDVRLPRPGSRFLAPAGIVRNVGRCRLVVTGAFHTAVFALSQGIPAVGVARTSMYVDKFRSLADQFGPGCAVIDLAGDGVTGRLVEAIDTAWEAADDLRAGLLDAAQRQIRLGQAAYRRLYDVVEAARATSQSTAGGRCLASRQAPGREAPRGRSPIVR